MPEEAAKVAAKLNELYPQLESGGIGVKAIRRDDRWLVFLCKEGHEEAFELPGDFVTSCVEQGYCHLYREECTLALGRLIKACESFKASAAAVVEKIMQLVPELRDPEITIAVSEDEPSWSFFMTRRGASRPVEYRLPMEVISRCLDDGDCAELRKASVIALRCLLGE